MKNKAIISLIMIVAMVLGMSVAQAEDWTASGSIDSSNGWDVSGPFSGTLPGSVYATGNDGTGIHAITVGSSGNFSLTVKFKAQGSNTSAFFGINTKDDSSGEILAGYGSGDGMELGPFGYIVGGNMNEFQSLNVGVPNQGFEYTVTISSTDGGKNAVLNVNGGSKTVSLSDKPKSVVIYLNNGDTATKSAVTVPVVTSISFTTSNSTTSPTPTISPTPTTTPTKTDYALNLQAIRDFYAKQPVGHMSNQSVVYNPDGTIKQVITGTQAVATPTATVTPTTIPTNVTPTATPTTTAPTTTATAVPPTPTTTQSPGFEIVLAAIGMISALVLITRKKK